jgi:hypothetical protein
LTIERKMPDEADNRAVNELANEADNRAVNELANEADNRAVNELANEADNRSVNEPANEAQKTVGNEAGNEAERLLAERLTLTEPEREDPVSEAVRRLPPKWEIRIQTKHDPVAEETAVYRSLAEEIDDRYHDRLKPKPADD